MNLRRLLLLQLVLVLGVLALTWPLLQAAAILIPGGGAGDNVTFVWNIWWIRKALSSHASIFKSSYLFAPFGIDLTLHTEAVLPSLAAAVIAKSRSIVVATNMMVVISLWLNMVAASVLALRVTRHAAGALLVALIFGWSPFFGEHLQGHFNLLAAAPLPLAAFFLAETLEDGRRMPAVLLGLTVGCLPYVDYYYAVFGCALIALILGQGWLRAAYDRTQPLRRWQRTSLRLLGGLLAADVVLIAGVLLTGGTAFQLGGYPVSVRRPDNAITAAEGLVILAALTTLAHRFRMEYDWPRLTSDLRKLRVSILLAALAWLPLAGRAIAMWQRGDYVTQRYLWRSAPTGVDAATFLLGNPCGLVTGHLSTALYGHFRLDAIEQVAWIGPGVLLLCAAAGLFKHREPTFRRWLLVVAFFLCWSAGPFLMFAGHSLHVMLPETALRFLPIASNARIPGRAMCLVYLGVAVIAGLGFEALRQKGHSMIAWSLFVLALVDLIPAPAPVYRLEHPAIYDLLAEQPPGIVLELPMGLRDGFGEVGRFDVRVLWFQTIHQHPLAGGSVARLPPRIEDGYQRMPVVGSLLRLSSGGSPAAEPQAAGRDSSRLLHERGFEYVVTDNAAMPEALAQFVSALPLRILATGDGRTLYRIE